MIRKHILAKQIILSLKENLMRIPNLVLKVIGGGGHFIGGNSLRFPVFPYFPTFLREFSSIKWQPGKISKKWQVTLWRPLWRFYEELTIFPWLCLIRDFPSKKGISRDFEGKLSGSGQFLTGINFCSYFLKVLTEMLLWCNFQVFWTIFGWFRAHFMSKSGIFPSNFIKGKSHFQSIPMRTKTAKESQKAIIFTFRKNFWICKKFSII